MGGHVCRCDIGAVLSQLENSVIFGVRNGNSGFHYSLILSGFCNWWTHKQYHPSFPAWRVRFGTNIERLQMMKDAVSILKKDPLTGIGPEAYKFVVTGRHKHMRISMDHVHILATAGLIGFVTYIWLIFGFVQRCLKTEQTERKKGAFGLYHILSICLFAAFIGFLVCGSFEPMFFSTRRLRFMMFLLGINECLLELQYTRRKIRKKIMLKFPIVYKQFAKSNYLPMAGLKTCKKYRT